MRFATYKEPYKKEINEEIYAFLSIDPETGSEAILSERMVLNGHLTIMPLIGSDQDRIDSFKPIAIELAKKRNLKVKLVKFVRKEVIEEF